MVALASARGTVLRAMLVALFVFAPVAVDADGAERFTAGRMLVASRNLGDPNFAETVVYMVKHDSKGALGLIVNRPLGSGPLDRFLAGFGVTAPDNSGRVRLHWGGPVERGLGFVLHTDDFADATTEIPGRGFAWTPSLEPLKSAAEGKAPKRYIFSLGYAGWSAGQLEGEIARGDWSIVPADADIVFGEDDKTKWKRASAKAGIRL